MIAHKEALWRQFLQDVEAIGPERASTRWRKGYYWALKRLYFCTRCTPCRWGTPFFDGPDPDAPPKTSVQSVSLIEPELVSEHAEAAEAVVSSDAWKVEVAYADRGGFSVSRSPQLVRDLRGGFAPNPATFHNDYEQSKWDSERLGVQWAECTGGEITIHRPSILVGAYESGRATKFGGVYLSAKATELLDRIYSEHTPAERQSIPLRIVGRPLDRQNIVPVDYAAKMIVAAVTLPDGGGKVYNLVHSDPPSNLQIKQAFELYFALGGGRFIPPEQFDYEELNDLERSFYDVIKPIEHYFVDTPTFQRANTAYLERRAGITCPAYDPQAIARLVRYAQSTSWGRTSRTDTAESLSSSPGEVGCAEYFESFLPFHVEKSRVAQVTGLTAVVSFVIDDEPEGRWLCAFDRGRLTDVSRGMNGRKEDFGYKTTRSVFWESVSGRPHPQELFLTGRAEMFGQIERALKMSMVLHSFAKEFPCDPQILGRFVGESCLRS